jgi:hypothetical protein
MIGFHISLKLVDDSCGKVLDFTGAAKQHEASQRPQNHCPVSRPPVAGPCLQPKPAKSSAYCDVF